jgi:hypothetical protein
MANELTIVPTKHKDEFFNPDKLIEILKKEFPKFQFISDDDKPNLSGFYTGVKGTIFNIDVLRNEDSSTTINWKSECLLTLRLYTKVDIIDRDYDIKALDEMGKDDMAYDLVYFLEYQNEGRGIGIRYTPAITEIRMITRFFRTYFQSIVFDEGIHPEFYRPLKIEEEPIKKEPNKGIMAKFKDFINRKGKS